MLADSGIPAAMMGLAGRAGPQYMVVYTRPEGSAPPKKINVGITRAGVKVRARTEMPRASGSK